MIHYSKRNASRLLFCLVFTLVLGSCSQDTDGTLEPIDRSGNLLSTGESAKDLLSNANFDELVIQIAYVEGFRPSEIALADLREFLLLRTFKEVVRFEFLPLPSPDKETLTPQEIADLEDENRTFYNNGRTLALYIYFADAPSSSDDPKANIFTLGAVYRNTSMVMHGSAIRQLAYSSGGFTRAEVEAATLTHEFGHLFGLVNLGTPEITPHEDTRTANHCLEFGCLMQASLKFNLGMAKVLQERAAKNLTVVPDLGPECSRDLQAIGGR